MYRAVNMRTGASDLPREFRTIALAWLLVNVSPENRGNWTVKCEAVELPEPAEVALAPIVAPLPVATAVRGLSEETMRECREAQARLAAAEKAALHAQVFRDVADDSPLSDADLNRMAEEDRIRLLESADGQHDILTESRSFNP